MIRKGTLVHWKSDNQISEGQVEKTFHSRLAKTSAADPLDLKTKNQRVLYIKQNNGDFVFKSEIDVVKSSS